MQDKYDGTERTDVEVRELFNRNRGTENIKNMEKEVEFHTENGCNELDIDDVDGNFETGHQHQISKDSTIIYEGNEMTVEQVASLPRFKISPEEFVAKYNNCAHERNGDEEFEDIYDDIEEEVNKDFRDLPNY